MDYKQKQLDLYKVQWQTDKAKRRMESTIRLYNQYMTDPEQKQRLEKQECTVCFYADSRIGGAAMTSSNCAGCNKPMGFGSTCVDLLCQDCACKLRLCKHCGADMEYKMRRKLNLTQIDTSTWPPPPPPEPRTNHPQWMILPKKETS
jgi:hypothetical protein